MTARLPLVSMTLLSILANLNITVVCQVSIFSLITYSSCFFSKLFGGSLQAHQLQYGQFQSLPRFPVGHLSYPVVLSLEIFLSYFCCFRLLYDKPPPLFLHIIYTCHSVAYYKAPLVV